MIMADKRQEKYKLFSEHKVRLKEELKDLKVIYTDMDGTLLNDQGCAIKDADGRYYFEVLKLFERIERNNWDIVPVSGRSKVQLRYNAMLLGIKNYIPELGCEMVYNLGEKVFITFDNSKYGYEITNKGKDLIRIIELFKKYFQGKIDSNLEWSIGRTYNALFFGDIDVKYANEILSKNGYEGLALVDNGFSKLVNLSLDVENLKIYNLIPKDVDKSSAVKLDKKVRKLKAKNCIALGDSVEDLKMAKEVHAFFLMRDAVEMDEGILDLIKNNSNVYVTGQRMNRGWVEVIKYLAQ
ncbi:MAG: HAD family phosphatase [Actinobacteria bacterium]|nr:HAD family phosphatase [Actinomycetota bacterium]